MGYRSDVGYVIKFKDTKTMKEFVGLHAINEPTRDALQECALSYDGDEPVLSFMATAVKWYESYQDVQAHESLLAFIDENEELEAGYVYVRIGEEVEDVEEKHGGADDLIPWSGVYVERTLAWNVSESENVDEKGLIAHIAEL